MEKLKLELPHDPAIPLLGIYLERMKSVTWKDTGTPMFTAALSAIAKTWKEPKCPSSDERMDKDFLHPHTQNGISLSHRKEWNNAIYRNMDELKDYHTKWSKSEGERQKPYDST